MRKPKPIRLTFEPWSDPKPGKLYQGRISELSAYRESVSVTVVNLDKTMAGRLHRCELPKALHTDNRTCRFASAAGLDVHEFGDQINLRDSIGTVIGMRFTPAGDDYEITFERTTPKAKTPKGRGETDLPKPSVNEFPDNPDTSPDRSDISFPYREDTE
jgi:hypothetical protein